MRISTAQVKLGFLTMLMMTFISFGAYSQVIPFNDDCADALKVYVGDIDFGTTTNATADAVPFCGVSIQAPGVWYTIQGNGDTLVADLCTFGALYNARINVYSGSCGSLVCVTGDDNSCGPSNYPRATWVSQMCETYYVLVQGTNGETGDFIITFQSPTPSLIANPGPNVEICEFQTYQLPGSASGAFPPFSYSWSPAAHLSATNIANPVFTPPSPGTYTYTLTVTDAEGCTDANPVTITVHPLPVVSFSGLNPEYCLNNAPTQLTPNPMGGAFSGTGIVFSALDTTIVMNQSTSMRQVVGPSPFIPFLGSPGPINKGWEARQHIQIYTAAELASAGLQPGDVLDQLGWDIISALNPGETLPSYTIRIQHTSSLVASTLDGSGTWTTVKNAFTYTPVAGGYQMLAFDAPFTWNGTQNLAVYICFGPAAPWGSRGVARAFQNLNTTQVFHRFQDGINGCVTTPAFSSTSGLKYNVQLRATTTTYDTIISPVIGQADAAVFDPGVAGPGTHWVYYTYTDSNGCTNVDSQSTFVFDLTPTFFTGLDPEYCVNGDSSILIGAPSGGTFSGPVTPFGQTFFDTTIVATCDPVNNFAGYYDPANWTFQNVPAGVSGSVNTAGAPASITLTGGDAGVGGSTQYRIGVPCNGTVTFNWSYSTVDGPFWDPFGYVLNGTFVVLTNSGGALNQSGSASVNVAAGDVFGFSQNTFDGAFGPGITIITNFVGVESGLDTIYTQLPAGDVAIFYPDQAGVGTHWVVYSFTDSNGCTNPDSQMVEVLPLPVVTSSGINPTPYCIDNQTYPLTGSPVGGVFSGPGVTDLGGGMGEWSPAAAGYVGFYNIVYTFTDSNGCTNADTQVAEIIATGNDLCEDAIIVQVGQTISGTTECATIDIAPFCVVGIDAPGVWYKIIGTGGTITADLCIIPGTTYDTRINIYSGDCNNLVCVTGNDDGPGCGFAYPSTVTWNSSPCVEYFILVQGFNGLVGDFVMRITGSTQSLNAHAGADQAICDEETATLGGSPAATGGNPGYTYNWSPAAELSSATAANPVFTPATFGVYTFTLEVTDNTGCIAYDSTTVTVHELPSPSIIGLASAYCIDDEMVVISGDPTGGTFTGPGLVTLPYGGTVYNSSFTAVPQAIPNNDPAGISISHTVNVPGTGLGVDINLDSVTVVISHTWVGDLYLEIENPAGTIVTLLDRPGVPASAAGCSADNVNARFVLGTGNSAETACDFTFPQVAIKGSYTAHDGFDLNSLNDGTSPNGAWEITVKDLRNPDFGSVQGITLHFSGQGTGFVPNSLAPGTYTITYTYTDGNGCTGIVDQDVTINDLPVVDFTGLEPTYCFADEVDTLIGIPAGGRFNGSGVIVDYPGASTGQWGSGSFYTTFPSPFMNYASGTRSQYLYSAADLSALGLSAGDAITKVSWDISNTNNIQPLDNYSVSMALTGLTTLTGGWATGLNTVYGPTTQTVTTGINTIQLDVPFLWDGTSNLVINICNVQSDLTSSSNASFLYNSSFNFGMARYYGINGNPNACDLATGFNTSIRPVTWFEYTAASNLAGAVSVFNPSDAGPGSHTVTYTYTDGNGCTNDTSKTTLVYPELFADAGANTTICENETIELGGTPTADGGMSPYTYSWSPTTGLDDASAANPVFTPTMSTTINFTLTVTDSVGCMAMDEVEIFVDTIPFVEMSLSSGETEFCLNAPCDTLIGFPEGGVFAGPGVTGAGGGGGGGGGGGTVSNITYSEQFFQSQTPVAQAQAWCSFRASLLATNTYTTLTVKGSQNPTGVTLTDPVIVTNIANALRTATNYSAVSGGNTWNVTTGCVSGSSPCGGSPGVVLSVNTTSCACNAASPSIYVLRPEINNANWGGINTATCGGPTQTMEAIFELAGTGGGGGGGGGSAPCGTITQNVSGRYGTSSTINGTTGPGPVNIWFRRSVIQMVYTAAELSAMGITGPADITSIAWHVYNRPLHNIPGYTIKMQNTTQANVAVALPAGNFVQVKNPFLFSPVGSFAFPGIVNTIPLDVPFVWDGVSNLGIELCWNQVQPGFNASGQVFVQSPLPSGSMRYSWTDAAGTSCGATPFTVLSYKPWITIEATSTIVGPPCETYFCPDSAGPGQHWITYTYTGDNGCSNVDSILVTVNDLPTITVTPTDTMVCRGEPVVLTAEASGTVGPYTYTWAPSAGLDTDTGPVVTATPDSTTIYTITVTDSIGCSNTFEYELIINQLPDITLTIYQGSDSACFGDQVCIAASVAGYTEGAFLPELMYFKFDQSGTTQAVNDASAPVGNNPAPILGGALRQTGVGMSGTMLQGAGVNSGTNYVNTGWGTELSGDWTIGFWLSNMPNNLNTWYIFGDADAGMSARVAGTAGSVFAPPTPNRLAFNVPGLPEMRIEPIGAIAPGFAPVYIHYIYNNTLGELKGYVNGQLREVENGFTGGISGAGPFKLGGYGTQPGMSNGMKLDEFRMYNRAISEQEILVTWNYANLSNASTGLTYEWSTGSNYDSVCVTATAPTWIYLTVTDSFGCIGVDSIFFHTNPEIFVVAGPSATIDLCNGQTFELGGNPTASGGTGDFTYAWAPKDRLNDSTLANPTTNTLLMITYTVSATDSVGCTVTDEITVIGRKLPKADAGGDVTICLDESVVIGGIPAATGGTGPYTYEWMPATGLDDPTLPNPTASPDTTTSYTLWVTDIYGCQDDSIMRVIVYPLPNVVIDSIGVFCDNDAPVVLTAGSIGGTWSGPGIIDPSTGLFDPSVAGAGVHEIAYSNVSFFGCIDSDTVMVTVNASPLVAITSPLSYCLDGMAVPLTANVAGGVWSGNGIVDAITGLFDPGTAGLGAHPITYTYMAVNGCSNSATEMVTVELGPDPSINMVAPLCSGDPAITLTAVTPGGTWSGPGITNPSAGTFHPGVAGVGTHTIMYTVTGTTGCLASASIDITVNGLVNFGLSAAGPFCQEGTSVILVATVGGGYWHGPGVVNPLSGEFRPAVAGPGIHTILYTITSPEGCISTDSTQIVVNASPNSAITAAGPFCANDAAVTLSAATPSGSWSGPGITNATTGLFNPAVAGPGTHTVVYSVTDLNGCSSSSARVIKVNELPVISGTSFDVTCPGDLNGKIEIRVEGGAPPYDYTWSNGANTLNIDEIGPGTYTITVTDAQGCSNEATFTVGTLSTPIAVTANITPATTPVYDNGAIDITVTGGTPPYQYEWSNGAVTQDITGLRPDTFSVTIIDAFGCTQTFTFVVPAQFQTGIDISDLSKSITLYPNPTSDVININIELGGITADLDMTVFDVLGRKVYERADVINTTYNHSISMASWASGQYMIRFKIGEEIVTKKFVLTK